MDSPRSPRGAVAERRALMRVADPGPGPRDVESALARVLSSDPVKAARRSADFLTFVVAEVLAGRGDRLKERSIAVGALGRTDRFDPRVDPSVRVQARRVRAALDRYYAGPGVADPVRIELPRGRYVPVFRANDSTAPDGRERVGIAVMPLVNLIPGGEHDHLAPGLSETLVAGLSRLPAYRVIGPVTPDASAGTEPPALRAGHRAQFVLMGSTRAWGGVLRVSLRLVDTSAGETVWAEVFDRRIAEADPFGAEDGIVGEVVRALADHRELMGAERTRVPPADQPPVNDVVSDYT